MTFAIGTGVLVLVMLLGVPIGFALGIVGIVNLSMILPFRPIEVLMGTVVHATTASSLLMSIPMFVLMAEFLSVGGVARDLLLSCNRLMRRIRGGLAMACIMAGTVHAAATGSSTASAASLARASFPAMMKAGYARSFAVGTISCAGTLAIMIPPSVAFILYGIMTETSVGKLFVAGIIPGLLTALGYIVTISITLRLRPNLGPKRDEGAVAVAASDQGGKVWPMVVLIAIVLGGLYAGVATPTEIASIGALGAFLLSLASGRMTKAGFIDAVAGTMRITSMVLLIIIGANLLGYFVSFTKVTETLLQWIAASGVSPTMVVLILVGIYLILGMFMDQAAILILTAPITTALVVGLGYDPVWWGVIIIKTAEIGMMSPPLGLVVYVVSASTKTDLPTSFVGTVPFMVTELVTLLLLIFIPQLSLWLGSF